MMTFEEQQIPAKAEKQAKRPMHPALKFVLGGAGKYIFYVAFAVGILVLKDHPEIIDLKALIAIFVFLQIGAFIFRTTILKFALGVAVISAAVYIYVIYLGGKI